VIARPISLIAVVFALAACPPLKGTRSGATVKASDLPSSVTDLIKYADDQYKLGTAEGMENSLAAIDKALGLEPQNYETLWRGARATGWLTDEFADRRVAYGERGVDYADKAIAIDPKRVEGQYYKGINLGQVARAKNGRSLVPKVLEAGKAAIAADAKFDYGGPLRLTGALLATAPEPPTSVGDREEGLKTLKQAIDVAPGYPLNHLLYADGLLKDKNFDAAEREYNTVLNAPPQPQWATRIAKWHKEAEDGLNRVRNARRGATSSSTGGIP